MTKTEFEERRMTNKEAKSWLKLLLRDKYAFNSGDRDAFMAAIKALEQEPKTGHWIDEPGKIPKCSKCGIYSDDADQGYDNYCPNCGAKMDEPRESEGV